MRGKFLFGIGLLAFAAAGAGSAVAADFPVKTAPPPPAAAPALVPDWVGFYIGIHGGGGGGHTSFDPQHFFTSTTFLGTPFAATDANPSGGVFGFQFGHNWQWGPVVGGLEVDFSGADLHETSTFFILPTFPFDTFTREVKIDELASARGRLGYLIFPNWLLYGTAGIGWGHFRLNTTDTFAVPGFASFTTATSFDNEFGWVVGAGVEWKFWNNWLLRGEWLHYDFGRVSHFDTAFPFPFDNVNTRTTIDIGRAALSYKF